MTKTEKIEALKKTKEALDELMIFVSREDVNFEIHIIIDGETTLHNLATLNTWKKHLEETD